MKQLTLIRGAQGVVDCTNVPITTPCEHQPGCDCTVAEEDVARSKPLLRAQPPAREDAQPVWVDGVPTKHHAKEWFIAETTFGERVVLTALPEEYTYDFKTADATYIKADRIKRWMPFPDSQYLFPHPAPDALRVAVEEIAAERQRQVDSEGWSAAQDDGYVDAELAKAAAAYTLSACGFTPDAAREMWPRSWSARWWKPTTARRDLVKAGALIVAEIERLDRQALQAEQED